MPGGDAMKRPKIIRLTASEVLDLISYLSLYADVCVFEHNDSARAKEIQRLVRVIEKQT
jgi:hypothetical protein